MPMLEREVFIPAPREEVFEFFQDPRNLRRITPKSLGFKITKIDELPMMAGLQISYTISPMVLPMGWRTTIAEWDPPNGFADVQTKGPYKKWRHHHTFEEVEGGTLMRDRVQYELPLGILGTIAHRLIVARQLRHIFDYRARRIRKFFAKEKEAAAA
ncbi:MAG TPA: SRPBCC family protein [Dehalococcoidia bacterium]|nr:SRPBCC family protein [Dehalococcoidia bacterium]